LCSIDKRQPNYFIAKISFVVGANLRGSYEDGPFGAHKFDYEANALIRRFPFFQGRITGVIMMGSYSEASRSIFASEKGGFQEEHFCIFWVKI
jgi:hypothetical protein